MSVPSPTNSSHLLIQLYCSGPITQVCGNTEGRLSVTSREHLLSEGGQCQKNVGYSCSNSREVQSYNILEHLIDAQHHQHAGRIWDDCMAACLH